MLKNSVSLQHCVPNCVCPVHSAEATRDAG